MNDPANLVLAVAGFAVLWTASIISGMVWLNGKFRDIESTVYREINKHKDEDDRKFQNHGDRIIRLELRRNGFAESPNGGK